MQEIIILITVYPYNRPKSICSDRQFAIGYDDIQTPNKFYVDQFYSFTNLYCSTFDKLTNLYCIDLFWDSCIVVLL